MPQFTVTEIECQVDRTLLYGHPKWSTYYVITQPDVEVSVGDTISYDPEGFNFGRFKALIQE